MYVTLILIHSMIILGRILITGSRKNISIRRWQNCLIQVVIVMNDPKILEKAGFDRIIDNFKPLIKAVNPNDYNSMQNKPSLDGVELIGNRDLPMTNMDIDDIVKW